MKKEVVILTNPLNHEGGVVNYYNLFFRFFRSDSWQLRHFSAGSRTGLFYYPVLKRILYPFIYCYDLLRFILLLLNNRQIKIVQISPSLIPVPLLRDGVFLMLGRMFGKKGIIFFRGWKLPTLQRIEQSRWLRWLFQKVFLHEGQMIIVLSTSFKADLLRLGADTTSIHVTTTAIDKAQVKLALNDQKISGFEAPSTRVLFLGRVARLKGCDEIIDSIIQLHRTGKLGSYKFTIVGHEDKKGYRSHLQGRLKAAGVETQTVCFPGRVTGESKYKLYAQHDVYLLPSYTEGCPNSVLEALASGMYCLTTDVGALPDLINPPENGDFVKLKSTDSIVEKLELTSEHLPDIRQRRAKIAQEGQKQFDIRSIVAWFAQAYEEYAA